MVNWLATLLVKPHPLPRMDFSLGIPSQCRTLVVIPTMLAGTDGIEDLVEALEVRFLANRDDHLQFGLLTDFEDAAAESLPGDESLLRSAQAGIERLNEKYPRAPSPADSGALGGSFFLFHRPRRWNPEERLWMGFERKRGKLADLNALLRNGGKARFSLVVGDTALLSNVKYVITLDTDTQLPRDSARQFVGAMAHPLNRPRFAASGKPRTTGCRPKATGYCSRASASACPARAARDTRVCTAASPGSIRTRVPSPTSTRTCSRKGRSSARGSTTSTRSSRPSTGAFPRIAS